jgi:WD40 repeat protein
VKIRDAFISYGRRDSKQFATDLYQRMIGEGREVWFDQEDIPLGVDFQEQIYEGIETADNFIFIIAPHSVKSEYCLKEILHAIKFNKRIIPLLHVMPSNEEMAFMHKTIEKLNWIYFREGVDDYNKSYHGLIGLMNLHKEYVQKHTNILVASLQWQRNLRDTSLLLVGKSRQEAELWLETDFGNQQAPCQPSDLHCEYIAEAKKNANGLMTEAFLSYATENIALREKIQRSLTRRNITSWTNKGDITTGEIYGKAINLGIEQADNFIFFISPESVKSKYCLLEIEHASKYNKRIIPIYIRTTANEDFPEKLRGLQYIDCRESEDETKYNKAVEQLLVEINSDKRYFEQHKTFLVQALKWEQQNQNQSILLRGYNLEQAKTWLKLGKQRDINKPTTLHETYISESDAKSTQLNTEVFVSYSRTDGDFARKLNAELQINGKTTWFDQDSIASGADFQQEIYKGIAAADNFLFVISPQAINSPYCADEVEYAQKLNKRFVTLLLVDVDVKALPSALATVQWINFKPSVDFHTAFGELIRTLEIDREYVQNHTKWSLRSMEWFNKNKDKDLLLRGSELSVADLWLSDALKATKQPRPSQLQIEYIQTSKEDATAAILAEQQKARRLKLALIVSLFLLVGALVASFFAYYQSVKANEEAANAVTQQIKAEKNAQAAKKAEEQALQEKNKAIQQEKIANQEKEKAEIARKQAEIEKLNAVRAEGVAREQTRQAVESKKNAEKEKENAENAKIIAENAKLLAEQKTKEANESKKAVDKANESANFQLYRFNAKEFAVKAVEQENDTTGALLALTSFDLSSTAYDLIRKPKQYEAEIIEALQDASLKFDKSKGILQKAEAWGLVWDYTGDRIAYSDTIGNMMLSKLLNEDAANFPKIKRINNFKIPKTENLVRALTFNPTKSTEICFGTSDGNIILLNTVTQKQNILYNHNKQSVLGVAYCPEKQYLVSTSLNAKKSIVIWDIKTQKIYKEIAWNVPIGSFVLHKNYFIGADKAGNIVLMNLDELEKPPVSIYKRYANSFYSIAYHAEENHLAVGNLRGEVLYFKFEPENFRIGVSVPLEPQLFTKKHLGAVSASNFSKDGAWLATAGLDGVVMLWNLKQIENGKIEKIVPVRIDSQDQKVFSVIFDQHGKHVIFGGMTKLHIRPIDTNQLYDQLRNRLKNTDLTEQQWTYFKRGDLEKPTKKMKK